MRITNGSVNGTLTLEQHGKVLIFRIHWDDDDQVAFRYVDVPPHRALQEFLEANFARKL